MNYITRDATDMYSHDATPDVFSITKYTAAQHVQHYAYDRRRSASLCSYIKQQPDFIYWRLCKMKYC